MNCAHLFNGIGGFALAAHWMGWNNIMHCEIDPFCNKVMNHHFPNSFQHEDIRTTDFTIWRGRIDLLTGGDPCQPHSEAGQKKGKEDDRYLWPEYYRAIEEIRPTFVVNENVAGSIHNGVLDEKISNLEALGYAWWPPLVIPATALGFNHKRNRVWIIAHSNGIGLYSTEIQGRTTQKKQLQSNEEFITLKTLKDYSRRSKSGSHGIIDGIPATLDEHRIKALGNAIVPQVAFQLFKAIDQITQAS